MRTRMMPQSSGFDEMPIPPALILPRKGEEISPFPLYGGRSPVHNLQTTIVRIPGKENNTL